MAQIEDLSKNFKQACFNGKPDIRAHPNKIMQTTSDNMSIFMNT